MWNNKTDRQTYHIRDINDQLNVSFHWFHIFAIILKSWDDVKPRSLFILVCVVVLQMSTVILCKYPNNALHGSSCVLVTVSWCKEKQKSAYKFLILIHMEFPGVDVFLLFHVWPDVIDAQHAFHQQSHGVNSKHKEHCTSVAEGLHHVNTGFWCVNWYTACKDSLSLWSCKGTKTGD